MTKLSVNVNSIAYLRNRRNLPWPDLLQLTAIILGNGAAGITVHPRPDERHIRQSDVIDLKRLITSDFPDCEFSIEGYPSQEFLRLVEDTTPNQVLFVPDKPEQKTSDHGWDISRDYKLLTQSCSRFKDSGIRTSLFINPEPAASELAAEVGADRVEIYTGPYGGCFEPQTRIKLLADVVKTALAANDTGLGVNAGHDLTLNNIGYLLAKAPFIAEVSIGHGIMADALIYGFAKATRLYLEAISTAQAQAQAQASAAVDAAVDDKLI